MHSCKPDSSCGPCSRGARVWLNPAVAESDCCPEAVARPPVPQTLLRRPRFTARSAHLRAELLCMPRPDGRPLHPLPLCEPAGKHAGGESTPARANTLRKCAAAAAAPTCMDQLPESRRRGRRRGRSPEFRDARGRASGRTQTAGGDRRVEFSGLCGTRVFLQGCAGSFSGTSRTITSWYKRELKTRALCMGPHKSMHQLVFHRNCGHSANLCLFVRLFFPGPSRPNVETLYSCKFEVLPHSAPNGARASPRIIDILVTWTGPRRRLNEAGTVCSPGYTV